MKLGRHMPINSRPILAVEIAQQIGCETIQIFVNNPMSWRQPPDTPPEPGKLDPAAAFAQACIKHEQSPVVVHAPYLINLASPDTPIFDKSIALLRGTIQRAARFGAQYVVFHIGSHRGAGVEAGIQHIAAGLQQALPETPDGMIVLLENDVGAGNEVGYRIEHLAETLNLLPNYKHRLGICLDTAHLWGAGYNLGSEEEIERIVADIDRLIGVQSLPVIHLNDTKTALGGHLDRHARIGEGIIPAVGISALLRHPALQETAFILETPIESLDKENDRPDWAKDKEHLARVRALGLAAAPLTQANITTL